MDATNPAFSHAASWRAVTRRMRSKSIRLYRYTFKELLDNIMRSSALGGKQKSAAKGIRISNLQRLWCRNLRYHRGAKGLGALVILDVGRFSLFALR